MLAGRDIVAVATVLILCPAGVLAQSSLSDTPTAAPATLQPMEVIGVSPVLGSGIDRDKVPADVRSVTSSEIEETNQPGLTGALDQRLSAINLNDEQGSVFQPDVEYRGFDASPIFGVPQGLAVYQNGVRINEAFGDTVNWDLVPDFAIDRLDAISANPVFGLNALGGAIALQMKDGFSSPGGEVEFMGGSYGRAETTAQYGVQSGNWGAYLGASGLHDDGWRDASRTDIQQLYSDLGYETDVLRLHASFAYANNFLNATGPTPVQLLDQNYSAAFTLPQSMHNQLAFLTLTGSYAVSNDLSLDGNIYFRRFSQTLIDGNTSDIAACDPPRQNFLCLDGDYLYDLAGDKVPTSVLGGAIAGVVDHTATTTNGFGGTIQATATRPIWDRGNHFVAGIAIDHADTLATSTDELGYIQGSLNVQGLGIIIDQPDGTLAPVRLDAGNTYLGLYATDTFDVTDRFAVTASARYNLAQIDLLDLNGAALNGNHLYTHFNPALGATYKLAPNLTAYGGWSMANRIPTAGELACSDPAHPCALDAFFVSDPNLKQVVAQTFEAGLRGTFAIAPAPGRFSWNLGLFRTDSRDDIINIASPLVTGLGYFQNAGETRRQGVEAGLRYRNENWSAYVDYALVDATFQSALTISSPNNPYADINGDIFVHPGDHLPLIPEHRLKLGADYRVTPRWTVGAALIAESGFYVFGDESNQNPKVPGFWIVDLRTSYDITNRIQLFAHIDNMLDRKYATYAAYTDIGPVTSSLTITNPLSLAPAPPLGVFAGARVTF